MPSAWCKLPVAVARRVDIGPAAKIIFAYLLNRIGDNEVAWPGMRTIAADCGTTCPTVVKAIRQLEAVGLIDVDRPGTNPAGRSSRYSHGRTWKDLVRASPFNVKEPCTRRERNGGSDVQDSFTEVEPILRTTLEPVAAAPPFSLSSDKTARKKKKPKGRPTWLTPFWDAWKESFGGAPAAGPLARALKPLVTEHGEPKTLANWRVFLAKQDAAYIGPGTPGKFSSTFGSWNGKPTENGHVRDPTLDDDLERTRKLIADDQEHGRQVREEQAKRKTEQ